MAGAKTKRSTHVATKRKRSASARKGWETRRAREAAEARAAAARRKRAREARKKKRRERERVIEQARTTVERLQKRAHHAVETACEAADELRKARAGNVTQKRRRELQGVAVESAELAHAESQELHAAMLTLAALTGEKPQGRKAVRRARDKAEDVLRAMLELSAGTSDGPAWGRIRALWYEAKRQLWRATGKRYDHFLDVLYTIAESTETDWQIAYGVEGL